MPFEAIEGLSRFFQLLYIGITSVWQSFSLVVILLIFIGVQIGFIFLYFKIYRLVILLYPEVKRLFRSLDRFFS